jgi:toxin YoeB
MRLGFTDIGWEQYLYWQTTDPKIAGKINDLLKDCRRAPFSGLGKPEALKNELSGWWSRRITNEHRLLYRVEDDMLLVAQCRFHYSKR